MIDRGAADAFFARYAAAFDALYGDAVAALWHLPCGIADARDGQARLSWWTEAAAVNDNMRALCGVYRNAGVARARFELHGFTPMGTHHAHADVAWTLLRADGSVLQAFRTGYHLIRAADGLRVLLATAYQEKLDAMREQDSK